MFFNYLRLASSAGNFDLPITDAAWDDPFIIKGADGLGPPDIDISIARVPGQGGFFQNKDPQNKQIILRIGLNPAWDFGTTPQMLREQLYGLISGGYTGDQISVILMIDSSTEAARIDGYVSKMEIVPFSKDAQVQLTIDCLSPTFYALDDVTISGGSLSLTAPVVNNVGSAPAGFQINFTVAATVNANFLIQDPSGEKYMNIVGAGWVAGDTVTIDTRDGFRDAYYMHAGDKHSLLGFMTMDSVWMKLYKGNNNFTVTGTGKTWGTWRYKPQYWGV